MSNIFGKEVTDIVQLLSNEINIENSERNLGINCQGAQDIDHGKFVGKRYKSSNRNLA